MTLLHLVGNYVSGIPYMSKLAKSLIQTKLNRD
jgi:hypothetical protein